MTAYGVHDTYNLDSLYSYSYELYKVYLLSPQHKVLRSDAEAHATSRSTRSSGQGQRTDLRVSQRHPCNNQPNHHRDKHHDNHRDDNHS